MARPRFEEHARDQMKLRRISFREVRALLKSHSVVTVQAKDGPRGEAREWIRGEVGGRKLKALVTKTDPPRVVTVACPDE